MAGTLKKTETVQDVPDVTDYRIDRKNIVLTVAVLSAWIIFVLAVVSRSSVALSEDRLSLEFVAPLLFVILVSIVFLVIFCLPSTLKGEEDIVQGPVVVMHDECLTQGGNVT